MESFESGIKIIRQHEYIESVQLKGLGLNLLASGDGTEIIHHYLSAGTQWAMVPEEGWTAQEYVFIIKGELLYRNGEEETRLIAGDSCVASPIREHALFIAETDVEFLYVSSQPVFWNYSALVQNLMSLAVDIEKKDGYTSDHCDRIKRLSMVTGEAMGLSPSQMYYLNMAAFLHDVGKVRIPIEILNKPERLTSEEFEIIKHHTTYGRQMLEETGHPDMRKVGLIVEQHHERYDGMGYPNALKGEAISLEASIIAVVDAYDAMTTDRVYQKGRPKEEAISEITSCRGTHFNPKVVDIFLSISEQLD